MNKHVGSVAAVAVAWAMAAPAMACDEDAQQTAAFAAPVLEQTLDRLRAEQREQIARSARGALAQLRSDTATARAQGAAPRAGTAMRAGP